MSAEKPLPPPPREHGRRMRIHLPNGGRADVFDDGCRFWLLPLDVLGADEWLPWGEHKQFDVPAIGDGFSELIWLGLRAMGGEEIL